MFAEKQGISTKQYAVVINITKDKPEISQGD
jgi:hypothetical protein